jgi:hypothetical protein
MINWGRFAEGQVDEVDLAHRSALLGKLDPLQLCLPYVSTRVSSAYPAENVVC